MVRTLLVICPAHAACMCSQSIARGFSKMMMMLEFLVAVCWALIFLSLMFYAVQLKRKRYKLCKLIKKTVKLFLISARTSETFVIFIMR